MVSIKQVVIVSALVSFCGAYKEEERVSCPSCMHVYYKVNKECARNTIEPDVCPRPLIPRFLENTCQHTTRTIVAKGLKNISANAKLKMTFIVRQCAMVPAGQTSGCTDLMALPESVRTGIMAPIKRLEKSWTNVTQTYQICKVLA
ncbi:hypothetical protein DPMN_051953 [Dreissena polymorpha]|uniref:Uncharacterized protein n=1 Tax=Dreissena polymorpha TaxID=45954 RepID=A0A9D4CKC4_DREPO|nr:hypothetical protein DPMN_051953 [Dreissena polymorpha]